MQITSLTIYWIFAKVFFAKEYQFVSNHNEGLNVGYGLGKTGMRHKFDYSDKQAGYGKSIITLNWRYKWKYLDDASLEELNF